MKKKATDNKLGELHGVLADIYSHELNIMNESGDYDIQLLKGAQAFLKDNNITSNIEDTPALGEINNKVIMMDESALPIGSDYKVVNG